MRLWSFLTLAAAAAVLGGAARAQTGAVQFTVHSARSGPWSDAGTWAEKRVPRAGDCVQVRTGHRVVYDAATEQPIRVVHVAGTLAFSREKSTRLDVGLLKIQAGDQITEDGFECDAHSAVTPAGSPQRPSLEIGTAEEPIPAGITARIRLAYFDGMNRETLPAIINCGGRWDIHGAPLSRTWVKLDAPAGAGASTVSLMHPVTGWRVGDRVIVTGSRERYSGRSFRKPGGGPSGETEERLITRIDGAEITLDRPLEKEHFGGGSLRSEVANLSRNVVVESADPQGVRGHTMYHLNSTGGVSYAEFRHLGKEGVLGKYSLHFHLVRDSMRGSGVTGASIWDSANRWITIHGTDYLLVRDCVGYQSVGHGYFLEDGTEQYNVFDRNLAVQAYRGKRLPKQVLPFDPNDGAGFWWANGRNTFTRNVSCENDEYGYRFEIAKRSNFDPELALLDPQGRMERRDVRTIPFLRFEDNESHTEGLYSFNLGDDVNPAVRGDRQHPFIVRNLRAWETHYVLRPNLQFFLADGLDVENAVYGVYHPDYDAHVYRNIRLRKVASEPINRGHDDDSIQYGSFTYENLKIEDCRVGRDPLIQLTCTSPNADAAGHFRGLEILNSTSSSKVVDLGGGPRNTRLEHPVSYYFHDYPAPGRTLRIASAKFPLSPDYRPVEGFTGPDVRGAEVEAVPFPQLLDPIDDLPPATLITSVRRLGKTLLVRGVTQDNGEVASVTVNDQPARIVSTHAGVVDWEVRLEAAGAVRAFATDQAGNREKLVHSRPAP